MFATASHRDPRHLLFSQRPPIVIHGTRKFLQRPSIEVHGTGEF
jgi:hypothetical protein